MILGLIIYIQFTILKVSLVIKVVWLVIEKKEIQSKNPKGLQTPDT